MHLYYWIVKPGMRHVFEPAAILDGLTFRTGGHMGRVNYFNISTSHLVPAKFGHKTRPLDLITYDHQG